MFLLFLVPPLDRVSRAIPIRLPLPAIEAASQRPLRVPRQACEIVQLRLNGRGLTASGIATLRAGAGADSRCCHYQGMHA